MTKTIGDRIKEKRLQNGLTLEEVGNFLGVSKVTIHKYESNLITNIPSDKIESLANFLKTTPSYLMGWEDTPTNNLEDFDDDMVVLARNAKSLTQDQKKLIKRMIDEFNKNNEE